MIKAGEIHFAEQPNIQNNPMPNHQAAQVGAVFLEPTGAERREIFYVGVDAWNNLENQGWPNFL